MVNGVAWLRSRRPSIKANSCEWTTEWRSGLMEISEHWTTLRVVSERVASGHIDRSCRYVGVSKTGEFDIG